VPPPGAATCVVLADGQPALDVQPATFGPWWELSPADLQDGPWCGTPSWRFDADLYRVRLLRVRVRLQGPATGQDGLTGAQGTILEFDVAPRNLWRAR
jgi:hypothetical protein